MEQSDVGRYLTRNDRKTKASLIASTTDQRDFRGDCCCKAQHRDSAPPFRYTVPPHLECFPPWTQRPDVVLCDIGLPGMDGYEVAGAFRKDDALKGTYLVALSGYDLQRASEAGFDCHLAKPPRLSKLEELLSSLPASGT